MEKEPDYKRLIVNLCYDIEKYCQGDFQSSLEHINVYDSEIVHWWENYKQNLKRDQARKYLVELFLEADSSGDLADQLLEQDLINLDNVPGVD